MKQTEDKLLLLIIIIVILMLIRMDAQDLSDEANLTDKETNYNNIKKCLDINLMVYYYTTMNKCPQCNGFGKIWGYGCPGFKVIELDCDFCKGTGKISNKQIIWRKRGEKLKKHRMDLRLTLREAARQYKYDAANLSKMERGIISPVNIYRR